MRIDKYFDAKALREFEKQLPNLRSCLGIRKIDADLESGYGVAGNTFRAFVGYRLRPSQVYRDWAKSQCEFIFNNADYLLNKIRSRESFLAWHKNLVNSLEEHWLDSMGKGIIFSHSRKLVDLFVKWLCHFNFGFSEITDLLVANSNCPLDSQSLAVLNRCLSGILPISKPSMGDVKNELSYEFCQDLIAQFSESVGGSRLLFDFFAWKYGG